MYLVWGIAVIGTIYKYFFIDKFEKSSLFLYILMGWLIVLDFDAVVATISAEGLKYMIFGGLFYMIGVIFYSLDRIKYNHVIWHIFVLAGSISHYMMVLTII